MKRISHRKSRRNSARRKRKVRARHRGAGRRRARAKPVFSAGAVHYEIGARTSAMSFGGIGAVRRLVSKLELAREIDARLNLLKRRLPYHESDHMLNIAYNLLCGGARLEDLDGLRHDAAYMDALGAELIPSPTAAGDFTRRFSESDVIELMECINTVRPRLWRGRGRDLLGPVAYVDVDGTLAPTLGRKKAGMDMSYKKVWGYHPLVVSLANTCEVLYVVNRPGNAVSHQGAAAWIDKALALVSPHVPGVCVRGDTDFSLTVNFDRLEREGGTSSSAMTRSRRSSSGPRLEEEHWKPLERKPRHVSRTGKARSKREHVKGRIVREMILVPCQVIRRARRRRSGSSAGNPTTDRLFSAWRPSSGPCSRPASADAAPGSPASSDDAAGTSVSRHQAPTAEPRTPHPRPATTPETAFRQALRPIVRDPKS